MAVPVFFCFEMGGWGWKVECLVDLLGRLMDLGRIGSRLVDWIGGLADGIRKSGRYVACLGSLATYRRSMLLVWAVLQHTDVLCCLFGLSCNIRMFYVACLGSLAIFGAAMLLVWAVLQYTERLFILFGQY